MDRFRYSFVMTYGNDTISLMFSHVSHGSMLDNKNQGMDEFGIRYGYRF